MVKNKQVLLRHTEEFKIEKIEGADGKQEVIISGNAQPLNVMSRNKVFYRPESVKKAYKSLQGVAFLNNHDTNKPLGHVQEVGLTDSHVTYKANVDPEEKDYIRKSERGDIRHVSVGCMVSNFEYSEEEGYVTVDVDEYVELSAVPVPGFVDTSAEREGLGEVMFLAEEFGDKGALEKIKAKTEEEKAKTEEDKKKENPKDDPDYDGDKDEDETDDDDKDKDKEADDDSEDDDKDNDKDKEGDDEDDDKDKDKDKDKEKDKDPDEEETDDSDDKDKDDKDKENLKEDAGAGAGGEEETAEEKLSKAMVQIEELFSESEEIKNRLAILESKVDALNDSEDEDADADTEEGKDIAPNKDEKFKDTHKHVERSKEEQEAKEKALTGKKTKTIEGNKDAVDLNKTRFNNSSY